MATLLKIPLILGIIGAAAFNILSNNQRLNYELFFEDDEETKRRKITHEEREESAFRRNLQGTFGSPNVPLEPIQVLQNLLRDPARR